jgi:NTP pyrophosphatase (non-canonical NTP hydrolase)
MSGSLPTAQQFDAYQQAAQETAQYPGRGEYEGIFYVSLGLGGESGEVLDEVKKSWRNDGEITPERREKILEELGDVLWYVAMLCSELGAPMESVAYNNTVKLAERARKNELKEHS